MDTARCAVWTQRNVLCGHSTLCCVDTAQCAVDTPQCAASTLHSVLLTRDAVQHSLDRRGTRSNIATTDAGRGSTRSTTSGVDLVVNIWANMSRNKLLCKRNAFFVPSSKTIVNVSFFFPKLENHRNTFFYSKSVFGVYARG